MNQKVGIFFLVIFSLSMASCSIQKRRYNKGFHIEWFHLENKESVKNKTKIQEESKRDESRKSKHKHIKHTDISFMPSLSAAIEAPKQIDYLTISSHVTEQNFTKETLIPAFKSGIKDKKAQSGDGKSQMMKGILYMILGGIIFWWISIIAGGLLMAIGFILFLIGISNLGKEPKPTTQPAAPAPPQDKKPEYQDVVYLKNGSIIRGMIIEQIPNVSIKIQTKDANVFVFKMDEIEKITKELEP